MSVSPTQQAAPSGPCFEAGPKDYFTFTPGYIATKQATMAGALSNCCEKNYVFDRNGLKWRGTGIKLPFKRSWWRVLLANTCYNPRITVTVQWRQPSAYRLENLKAVYSKAVDQDDDILTQFVEISELQRRIAEAASFDSLVAVYYWMKTDHAHGNKP